MEAGGAAKPTVAGGKLIGRKSNTYFISVTSRIDVRRASAKDVAGFEGLRSATPKQVFTLTLCDYVSPLAARSAAVLERQKNPHTATATSRSGDGRGRPRKKGGGDEGMAESGSWSTRSDVCEGSSSSPSWSTSVSPSPSSSSATVSSSCPGQQQKQQRLSILTPPRGGATRAGGGGRSEGAHEYLKLIHSTISAGAVKDCMFRRPLNGSFWCPVLDYISHCGYDMTLAKLFEDRCGRSRGFRSFPPSSQHSRRAFLQPPTFSLSCFGREIREDNETENKL